MITGFPDTSKVVEWSKYIVDQQEDIDEMNTMHREAVSFLKFYDWCLEIEETYIGLLYPGIVAVFLFKFTPHGDNVDDWVWVVVGDLAPAYITTEECPNPATALDGYIGAMSQWVDAAQKGNSVSELIPVNIPATKENARRLKARLEFLDEMILCEYQDDLNA